MSFARAVAFVLLPENDGQAYHVTAGDQGGPTAYGWALNENPDLTDADLRAMTPVTAAVRYQQKFWPAIKGDQLPDMLHIPMLDTAILEGPQTAIEFLQAALHVSEDGVLGPQTLRAAQVATLPPIVASFTAQRIFNLSTKRGWPTDGVGWTRRAVSAAVEANS
jgi:lysozyme family protein